MARFSHIHVVCKNDLTTVSPDVAAVIEAHLEKIRRYAAALGVAVSRSLLEMVKLTDDASQVLVVTVGGDGTVLTGAKHLHRSKRRGGVYPINCGTVGFLADFSDSAGVAELLTDDGAYPSDQRALLKPSGSLDSKWLALNDFVITREGFGESLSYFDLSLVDPDGAVLPLGRHHANAVLVSTPTGSSGYALSCGGPIMAPTVNALEVSFLAPRSLASRPIVVDDRVTVRVESPGNSLSVRCDGVANSVAWNGPLDINIHPRSVRIYHQRGWNHFQVLADKLRWIG